MTIAVDDSARHNPRMMPAGGVIPLKRTIRPIAHAEAITCTSPTPST